MPNFPSFNSFSTRRTFPKHHIHLPCLRLRRRDNKYQRNLRTLSEELIGIEENSSRREILSDGRDLVTAISNHQGHSLLEGNARSPAAVRVGHL